MEKKTKEIDTYKYTTVKKNINVFIARDGSEYKTEKQCLKHEEWLDKQDVFNKINKIEFANPCLDFPETWYYAKDEKELEMIKDNVEYNSTYNYVEVNGKSKKKATLSVGDWIGSVTEDGGDYRGTEHIYTLSYLREQISKFLNNF